jgi:hypothetical protein
VRAAVLLRLDHAHGAGQCTEDELTLLSSISEACLECVATEEAAGNDETACLAAGGACEGEEDAFELSEGCSSCLDSETDPAACGPPAGDEGAAFGASCAADGDCAGDLVCTGDYCACVDGLTYDSDSGACLDPVVCTVPSDTTGYTVTNNELNVATGFDVTAACATGYEGSSPAAAACTTSGDYTLSGCIAVVCTVPSDTTGYTVTNNELNVATGFDVTAACATGYEGSSPAAAACTTSGDYTLSGCIAVVAPAPTTCIFVDVVQDGDIDYAADSADMVQAHVCKDQIGEAPIEVKSTCSDSQVCLFSELIDCCVTSPNGVNGDCDGMLATCQAVANTMRDTSCGGEGR